MDWHRRFTQQARWTEALRRYLFARLDMGRPSRILEMGCGTGAALEAAQQNAAQQDAATVSPEQLYGLDIRRDFLKRAGQAASQALLVQGDARRPPFASHSFDCVYFHFTLLWIADPLSALSAARRLVRTGGWVMALAEPDYGGRIDYPEALVETGRLQEQALRRQGAETRLGRRLGGLFHQAGFQNIETGVISGQWGEPPSQDDLEQEWATLEDDLQGVISKAELAELRQIDLNAWRAGERTLFVPTFYAVGQGKDH